jgi:hypothetical protein
VPLNEKRKMVEEMELLGSSCLCVTCNDSEIEMTATSSTPVLIGIITAIMVLGIALGNQHIKAAPGFIANPTNNNNTGTGTTDPNYNTYQNLALGFSIKYLKNMTINQGLVNSTANTPDHNIRFQIPLDNPFKEHLTMVISIIPETNFLGQQGNLDQVLSNWLMNYYSGNNTVVTNKTKGLLNGFPAYKIDSTVLVPKPFKNITSSLGFDGIPITHQYQTTYVTFRGGIGYWITFLTYSQDRFNPVEKTMIDSFRYN